MSALPNSKSSFLRAAQGCGALALAGAMVLPMSPALAQSATADTTATAAASSQSGDRVRENPVATSDEFTPHLGYHSLKNTDEDQVLESRVGVSAARLTPRRVFRLLCERWV